MVCGGISMDKIVDYEAVALRVRMMFNSSEDKYAVNYGIITTVRSLIQCSSVITSK